MILMNSGEEILAEKLISHGWLTNEAAHDLRSEIANLEARIRSLVKERLVEMELHAEPAKIASEDIVHVQPDQHILYQQCCDCGLRHRIEIIERHPVLKLRFYNIGEASFEDDAARFGYSGIETHVEKIP